MLLDDESKSPRLRPTEFVAPIIAGLVVWLATGGAQSFAAGQLAVAPIVLGVSVIVGFGLSIAAWRRRRAITWSLYSAWSWITDRLFGVPVRYRFAGDVGSGKWTHYARLRPNRTFVFPSLGARLPTLMRDDHGEKRTLHFLVRRPYRLRFDYPPDQRDSGMPRLSTAYHDEGGSGYLFSLNSSSHPHYRTFLDNDVWVTLVPVANLRRGRYKGYHNGELVKRRIPWTRPPLRYR